VSWLLIQIATQVFPFFEIPMWAVRLVIILLALGFPVALLLAWAFDLTPGGIKRTDDLDESQQQNVAGGSKSIRATHIAPPPEKSIAVLPFENFSDDMQNAYFADGIQDDILSSLAKVADLKVTSRTSVRQYKTGTRNLREIGEALGVAYILEGSVRRESNRVRINAQLIDARTDQHVWNDTYDREITDLFELQSELARRISFALRENCRRAKRPVCKFIRPRTWPPMNFSCGPAISFGGAVQEIRAKTVSARFTCWTTPSSAIRTSLSRTAWLRAFTANSIGLGTTGVAGA
jgi:TolB-like protein